MKKIALIMLAFTLLLPGCSSRRTIESDNYYGFLLSELETLNYLISNTAAVQQTAALFVEPLARANRFGIIEPALARRWRASENYTVWNITLRRNVGWYTYTGERFAAITAHDFAAAINFILNPENSSVHYEFVSRYVYSIEARNNTTIIYTLHTPTPYFPSLLTKMPFLPVNADFLNNVGNDFGTSPETMLFSGSHLMQTWGDDGLVLVKNENYRLANLIGVNTITLMQPNPYADIIALFQAGLLSRAVLSAEQAQQAVENPNLARYVFQTEPYGATSFFMLNFGSPDANVATAFQNANFRNALFSAINRRALLSLTIPKNTDIFLTNTITMPQTAFNARNRDYLTFNALPAISQRQTHNPSEAEQLLELAKTELGDEVNWPITLIIPRHVSEFGVMESSLFKQMIESAFNGYVLIDFRHYNNDLEYAYFLARGEFDIGIASVAPTFGDPSAMLSAFLPGTELDNYFNFSALNEMAVFYEMFENALDQTAINPRFVQFAAAEQFLLENAIVLPFHQEGGKFALSRETDPFNVATSHYGLCRFSFLNRTFGNPIISLERTRMFEQYIRELGYATS